MEQFYVTNVKLSVHIPVYKFTVHMPVDQEEDAAACTRVKYSCQMLTNSGRILQVRP